jgi:valyl-tRNA synthetase
MVTAPAPNQAILQQGSLLKQVISGLRDLRNKQQMKPKEEISLSVQATNVNDYIHIKEILARQVNASIINFDGNPVSGAISTVIGRDKFFLVGSQPFDAGQQKEDLEKELSHLKGFLIIVEKKLGNERFVQNARPEVLALEQKKKSDAETKIKVIEESLAQL